MHKIAAFAARKYTPAAYLTGMRPALFTLRDVQPASGMRRTMYKSTRRFALRALASLQHWKEELRKSKENEEAEDICCRCDKNR